MKMDNFMLKFPHLFDQMVRKLNDENLFKSREVARSWQYFITERNYPWLRIVNIPTINRNEYLNFAAETGQTDALKIGLSEEEGKSIQKRYGITSFLLACENGHLNIVEFLLEHPTLNIDINDMFLLACEEDLINVVKFLLENVNLNVNINARDDNNHTGFVLACKEGYSNVAKGQLISKGLFAIFT